MVQEELVPALAYAGVRLMGTGRGQQEATALSFSALRDASTRLGSFI